MSSPLVAVRRPTYRNRIAITLATLVALWLGLDFVLPHVVSTAQTSTGQWQTPLPVVLRGVITGATYGVLAVGLVLIYRSSHLINFAHGEVGAFAAAFFGLEVVRWHLPYWVALVPALVVGAVASGLIDVLVIRRLTRAPLVLGVIATLVAGQFLAVLALVINSGADATTSFPQPSGLPSFQVGALSVTPAYTGMLILAPLAVAGIGGFLRLTRPGRAIRAAAANPATARLAGIPVKRMSTLAWGLAGALAALAAVLTQATSGFGGTDSFGPELLFIALTGAVLGRMTSVVGAMVGGLAIGIAQNLLLWNSPDSGLVELVMFVVILVALLLQRGRLGRDEDRGSWSIVEPVRPLPAHLRAVPTVRLLERLPWLLLFAVLAGLPLVLSNATSVHLAITFGFVIVAMSTVVMTGLAGQLSLGQFAVAAVGAFVSFEISRRTGNFFLSFAGAGLAGGLVTAALGVPAVRARGLLLAVTTLAFALVLPDYLLSRSWLLGSGRNPGRPIWFGHAFVSGHSYYYVGLATLAVSVLFARNVRRGGIGRRLVAVRDNESAARAFSVGATTVRFQSYLLAGFLAGLGGAMYGHALSQLSIDGFPTLASIEVVKIAVIGGLGALSGPLFGAVLVQGVDYVTLGSLGLALVTLAQLLVILLLPGGLVQLGAQLRDRCARALARRAGVSSPSGAAAGAPVPAAPSRRAPMPAFLAAPPPASGSEDPDVILAASGVRKSFAGIHAVRDLDLTVRVGETVGLIGPNGAGKTTTFEVISGFVRADAGTIQYHGKDVTRSSPQARARLGMIRSFQDAALFPTLTVGECVALALERRQTTSVAAELIGLTRADRRRLAQAAAIVDWIGLADELDQPVRELSTGVRRIAEIGCLIAAQPELLMLDEPSSGIAQHETESLGELLARMRSELSLSMVVIEHDIPLVMSLADRIVCMADGTVIATGSPAEVQADPRVIEAYLGAPVA